MAKKSGHKSAAELKSEIERSREDVVRRLDRVRDEIDLPKKIRRSVRREPVPWIIGAVAVGLIIVGVATRKRKVVVTAPRSSGKGKSSLLEAGFVLGALRVAATLLKPVVARFVEEKLGFHRSNQRPGPKGF